MKVRVLFLAVASFLFIAVNNTSTLNAKSNEALSQNTEKYDDVVATTSYKGKIPHQRKVNTLNAEGLCTSKVIYSWDVDKKVWEPSNKLEYTYENGKLTGIMHSDWNCKNKKWDSPKVTFYNMTE